jgi:hypothetical protein
MNRSMMQTAQRAATYEDLLAAPEHLIAEILFGRLVTRPRLKPRHAAASSALLALLGSEFSIKRSRPASWIVLNEPEVHLGPHVVVPGAAAWRQPRFNVPSEALWIDIRPDWVCDFSDPRTALSDARDRRTVYAKAGIQHFWHVDPDLRILEVYELRVGKWLRLDVFRDNAEVAASPFADPTFPLGLLWRFDPPAGAQG